MIVRLVGEPFCLAALHVDDPYLPERIVEVADPVEPVEELLVVTRRRAELLLLALLLRLLAIRLRRLPVEKCDLAAVPAARLPRLDC